MIRLKYRTNTYERSAELAMNNSDDNRPLRKILPFKNSADNGQESNQMKDKKFTIRKLKKYFVEGGAVTIVAGIVTVFFNQGKNIDILSYQISELSKTVATSADIRVLDNRIESLNNLSNRTWLDINDDITNIDNRINDLAVDVETLEYVNQMHLNSVEHNIKNTIMPMCKNDGMISITDSMWEESDVLAVDRVTKEKYTASELAGNKLILSYTQNNQDILFCGQFSANNKWDGECIVNVYEDNKLTLVTEALYDEGNLISYRQVFNFTTKAGEEVWCISKRKHTDGKNYGDSWNFYKETDIVLDFNLDEATFENIYTVNKLQDNIDRTHIEGLYHGCTSNGLYNDATGEAYLIKFSKYDGTVKTLYVGNFVNGSFSDNTGNAWYIVRDDNDMQAQYMYYTGKFELGEAIDKVTSENSKTNLESSDIKKYIESMFFKCELKWYGFAEL